MKPPWTRWLVLGEAGMLGIAGLSTAASKLGLLAWKPALVSVAFALFAAIIIGMASLLVVTWCMMRGKRGLTRWALAAAALATLPMAGMLLFGLRGVGVPPIHDISTDLADPPRFVRALELRAPGENPAAHAGRELAELQAQGYPDIGPLEVELPVADAFARSLQTAEALGWSIVAEVPEEGRIEAVAESLFFGFRDDVVIRIRSVDRGSRIDIRSASRVGVSDLGTNAARIRAFFKAFEKA